MTTTIAGLCEQAGIKPRELSKMAKVSPSTIYRILNEERVGKVKVHKSTFASICRAFKGILFESVEELLLQGLIPVGYGKPSGGKEDHASPTTSSQFCGVCHLELPKSGECGVCC